mgnify:CR=1 FL=1
MKLLIILFIFSSLANLSQKEDCKCSLPSSDIKTHWGQENVIIKRPESFRFLHGKVTKSGDEKPLEGVLVEVYDKPEGLLLGWKEREANKPNQRKIAACITGNDGEFCFDKIPPGKYELRCSKPTDWNCTSVYVVVAPTRHKSLASKIIVPMQISQ